VPREFNLPRLGLVREWAPSTPQLEVLLARESDLPTWTTISPKTFAAPFARIYWNTGDSITLELAKGGTPLPPECFAVIGPETPFIPRLHQPIRHFYLHVGIAWPWSLRSGVWLMPKEATKGAQRLLDELRIEVIPPQAEGLLTNALAQTVLAALPASAWEKAIDDPAIARAVSQIQRKLAAPPSNADLAAEMHLTIDAFIRRFRRATGSTPQAFALRLRLEEAARLLAHSTASMEEIATATGFFDRYHLTKAFSHARGVSPAVWRRHVRGREGF
jgi:AraC-like DNA-binding protein